MYEEIAEAEARLSLSDLHSLAWKYWWIDERAGYHQTPSPSLAAVNDAIVRVVSQLGTSLRFPRDSRVTDPALWQPSGSEILKDLALAPSMPDAPELAEGVEAMMKSVVSKGSVGGFRLYLEATYSSAIMRQRAACVFEGAGDHKRAKRLRKGLDKANPR